MLARTTSFFLLHEIVNELAGALMKGSDPAFVEASRLARKFFPESTSFLTDDSGLAWDSFLGAMMVADYQADYSCYPFSDPSSPDLGLSIKGGLEGSDIEIYLRLLSHSEIAPTGRALVVLDAIGTQGWSMEDCQPFVCDSRKVPERIHELGCFGKSRDTIFIFESGEALLIDHDDRIHWARSKINRKWTKG